MNFFVQVLQNNPSGSLTSLPDPLQMFVFLKCLEVIKKFIARFLNFNLNSVENRNFWPYL